jgi:hypothetical protein
VTTLIRVDKPPLTWDGLTLIGTEDPDDDTERGAILTGEHLDIRQGQRLIVTGRLLVIDHPPWVINRTAFVGFTGIRVETRPHWPAPVVPGGCHPELTGRAVPRSGRPTL